MELGSSYELDVNSIRYTAHNILEYMQNRETIYTDSGRSAIRFLTMGADKGKALLPEYICQSVIDCFAGGYEIEYYRLNERLEIDEEDIGRRLDNSVRVVYIMHYFGWMQGRDILEFIRERQQDYHYTILEDVTHCFLTCRESIGDYQICSLRKWVPVPDGGVVYSKNNTFSGRDIRQEPDSSAITEAMLLKYMYIHNGIDCNSIYRNRFEHRERTLDQQTQIYHISEMSSILLLCFDVDVISHRRKENWNYIYNALKHTPLMPLNDSCADGFVPFTFPVLAGDRDRLRNYLMEHNIYCAVHWPIKTKEQKSFDTSRYISEHILSLPIDQRYGPEELDYMLKVIASYY